MAALTGFVLKHKWLVLAGWLVVLIAAFAAVGPAGSALSQQFSIPGREGFETNEELAAIYGSGGDVAPIVPVVQLPPGTTVDSPGVREQLEAAVREDRGHAAGRDDRLLRLDRRPGIRLRRRPHHLGARLHPREGQH